MYTERDWQPAQPTSFSSSLLWYTFPSLSALLFALLFSSLPLLVFPYNFLCLLLDSTSLSFSDLWSALSWFHYELAEQVKPTGFWESVEPECRPLQPLHCRPRDLSHGVWKPLETGELKTHTGFFFLFLFFPKLLFLVFPLYWYVFTPPLDPSLDQQSILKK